MPQTQFKGYELQATGSNSGTWGTVLNSSVIDIVDTNMGATHQQALSSSNVTLSASQAQKVFLQLFGTVTAPVTVTSPAQGFYVVENGCINGGGSIVLTNGTGSSSSVVPFASRCVVFADSANGVRLFGAAFVTNPAEIPTGTQMLFTSAAVPTGWTLITGIDDYALQVTSGTGGVTAGSIAYSTLFGRTTTDGFALVDIPSHSHVINSIGSSGTGGGASGTAHWSHRTAVDGTATGTTDNNVGSGAAHTHPLDMRILSVTTIIGSRN